jgi:hypothetical protein
MPDGLSGRFGPRLLDEPEAVTRGKGSVFGSLWCPGSPCECSASIAAFMRLSRASDRTGLAA